MAIPKIDKQGIVSVDGNQIGIVGQLISNGFKSKSDVYKNYYQQEFPVFYNCGFYGNSSYSNPNPSTVSNYPNGILTATELQHIQENNKKMYGKV